MGVPRPQATLRLEIGRNVCFPPISLSEGRNPFFFPLSLFHTLSIPFSLVGRSAAGVVRTTEGARLGKEKEGGGVERGKKARKKEESKGKRGAEARGAGVERGEKNLTGLIFFGLFFFLSFFSRHGTNKGDGDGGGGGGDLAWLPFGGFCLAFWAAMFFFLFFFYSKRIILGVRASTS